MAEFTALLNLEFASNLDFQTVAAAAEFTKAKLVALPKLAL